MGLIIDKFKSVMEIGQSTGLTLAAVSNGKKGVKQYFQNWKAKLIPKNNRLSLLSLSEKTPIIKAQ